MDENVREFIRLIITESDVIKEKIPNKFRDANVIVLSTKKFGEQFFASWYLDRFLKPVIVIDQPVADAVNAGLLDLLPTLEHEHDEAKLAIELAKRAGKTVEYMKMNYTGFRPLNDYELDRFGGEAHEILVSNVGYKKFYKRSHRDHDIAYRTSIGRHDKERAKRKSKQ